MGGLGILGKLRTEVPRSSMRSSKSLGGGGGMLGKLRLIFLVNLYLKSVHEKLGGGGLFFAKNRVFCVILTTKYSR